MKQQSPGDSQTAGVCFSKFWKLGARGHGTSRSGVRRSHCPVTDWNHRWLKEQGHALQSLQRRESQPPSEGPASWRHHSGCEDVNIQIWFRPRSRKYFGRNLTSLALGGSCARGSWWLRSRVHWELSCLPWHAQTPATQKSIHRGPCPGASHCLMGDRNVITVHSV